jgi:hypothetical protein
VPPAKVMIRPAAQRDLRPLAQVMARAFVNDPVFEWMLPSPPARRRRLPLFFSNVLHHNYTNETTGGR